MDKLTVVHNSLFYIIPHGISRGEVKNKMELTNTMEISLSASALAEAYATISTMKAVPSQECVIVFQAMPQESLMSIILKRISKVTL